MMPMLRVLANGDCLGIAVNPQLVNWSVGELANEIHPLPLQLTNSPIP
jgi:hypothetical protein